MIFRKLVIENFRQFIGKQTFEFSSDPARRVTLIHAENGVGKTTFLNSIYWCLYGSFLPQTFDDQKSLVNDHMKAVEGLTQCAVELVFEHDGEQFRVVRTYDELKLSAIVQGFSLNDGNNVPIKSIESVIDRIMPASMGKYFLMAGETLQNLGRADSAKFREAVRTILGFDHAESVSEHLRSIVSNWNKDVSKATKLDAKLAAALAVKSNDAPKLQQQESDLKANSIHRETTEAEIARINQELGKISNKDIQTLNDKRQAVERQIKIVLPREIERVRKDRSGLIQKYGYSMFGFSFLSEAKKTLDKFAKDREIPSHYKDVFIKKLLDDALCICGSSLEEGTEPRAKVAELYEGATTKEQEHHIDKAKAAANQLQDLANDYTHDLERLITLETKLETELANCRREKESVDSELDQIDDSKKDELLTERDEAERHRDRLETHKYELQQNIRSLKESLAVAERDVNKGGAFAELNELKEREAFVQSLLDRLRRIVKEEDSSAIDEIQNLLNRKLEAYSRKEYRGKVDQDFTFTLHKESGRPIDKSTGESKLLSISFVSSLIELAKSRRNENSDFFVKGTVAPFAIDAPFTALDNSYRGAVAELLPECAEQFILMISSTDWQDVIKKPLIPKIGKQYLLVANVADDKKERRTEDEIDIGGATYLHTKYGSEVSCTTSVEIL